MGDLKQITHRIQATENWKSTSWPGKLNEERLAFGIMIGTGTGTGGSIRIALFNCRLPVFSKRLHFALARDPKQPSFRARDNFFRNSGATNCKSLAELSDPICCLPIISDRLRNQMTLIPANSRVWRRFGPNSGAEFRMRLESSQSGPNRGDLFRMGVAPWLHCWIRAEFCCGQGTRNYAKNLAASDEGVM